MAPLDNLWNDITGVSATEDALVSQEEGKNAAQELLYPYTAAGEAALAAQQDLLGMNGPGAQAAAVDRLENDPTFQALVEQGETGILQNASATGGLRGGNTQAAMAQFRPQMLNQQIQQQLGHLGGLAGMGMNATTQAANIESGFGNAAAAQQMAAYQLQRDFVMDLANMGAKAAGVGGF